MASLLTPPVLGAQFAEPPRLFDLSSGLESRSVSGENPTGQPGQGGKAASELGVGRKGAPRHTVQPGETYVLCDIEGHGTIRHIWMTGQWFDRPWLHETGRADMLRRLVIRVYWDGQKHPHIECPLGDFMGLAHSKITPYESAVHSVVERAAFNFWLPMPFTQRARITLANESTLACHVYHQIDYTLGDPHPADVGRLHAVFRRENPTTLRRDFELLPLRTGRGCYVGTVIGVRTLHPGWWGEGEVKVYRDGDAEFPTICGTGAEDYVGQSYGLAARTFLHFGCNLKYRSELATEAMDLGTGKTGPLHCEYVSMYRWHLRDPIYWKQQCRITIQQLGCCLYERDDDWSAATFWYESVPSAPLPPLAPLSARVADLDELLTPAAPASKAAVPPEVANPADPD